MGLLSVHLKGSVCGFPKKSDIENMIGNTCQLFYSNKFSKSMDPNGCWSVLTQLIIQVYIFKFWEAIISLFFLFDNLNYYIFSPNGFEIGQTQASEMKLSRALF